MIKSPLRYPVGKKLYKFLNENSDGFDDLETGAAFYFKFD